MKKLITTATVLLGVAAIAASALATQAEAGTVSLKAQPTDDDGQITLGELFDGAGSAASVVVGRRAGTTAVLDAAQVQIAARRAGLVWDNATGLRRIVVRQGAAAPVANTLTTASRSAGTVEALALTRNLATGEVVGPDDVAWTTVQAHQAPASVPQDANDIIGLSARRPMRAGQVLNSRDLAAPQVIARNEMVEVLYQVGGVELTITGRAQRNAALGDPVTILNLQSGRLIEAVAVAEGRALAGPAAQSGRPPRSNQYASR
jgi:flagellar basal body P-ring formation protein FlgA